MACVLISQNSYCGPSISLRLKHPEKFCTSSSSLYNLYSAAEGKNNFIVFTVSYLCELYKLGHQSFSWNDCHVGQSRENNICLLFFKSVTILYFCKFLLLIQLLVLFLDSNLAANTCMSNWNGIRYMIPL